MEGRICLIRVDSDRGDLLVESDVRVRGASLRRGPQASLCHASADHPDGTVGVFFEMEGGWRIGSRGNEWHNWISRSADSGTSHSAVLDPTAILSLRKGISGGFHDGGAARGQLRSISDRQCYPIELVSQLLILRRLSTLAKYMNEMIHSSNQIL